jgi:hypothetical protein
MFKYVVGLSAIAIAMCAAVFSISGIATLFAGKYFAVLLMAAALELGKLVAASFLYRFWDESALPLKTYLIVGVVVLMVITSVGIYGYLSSAYAEVAATPQATINQISLIESKQQTLTSNIDRWTTDNATLEARRRQAQTSLDNILGGNTELNQRSAFANLRQEIANLDEERNRNTELIQTAQAEHDSLSAEKAQQNANLNTESKLGTFIYFARTLGIPLDVVVKWFVLVLVFVFDPLAISLILAYNTIVKKEQDRGKTSTSTQPFQRLKERLPEEAQESAAQVVHELLENIENPSGPRPTQDQITEAASEPPPDHEGLERLRKWAAPGVRKHLAKRKKAPAKVNVSDEGLAKIAELVEDPPEPTEELKELMSGSVSPQKEKEDQSEWVKARDIAAKQHGVDAAAIPDLEDSHTKTRPGPLPGWSLTEFPFGPEERPTDYDPNLKDKS